MRRDEKYSKRKREEKKTTRTQKDSTPVINVIDWIKKSF